MDDLSEKLNGLLNDPEALNVALQNARQLLSQSEEEPKEQTKKDLASDGITDVANLTRIISTIRQSGESEDDALLLALKPHLSKDKAEKVDTALKILRLIKIAPLLINGLEGIL